MNEAGSFNNQTSLISRPDASPLSGLASNFGHFDSESTSISLSKLMAEIAPVEIDEQPAPAQGSKWISFICSTVSSFTNYLSHLQLLPMAEAAEPNLPKFRITTDNCNTEKTMQREPGCNVMVKISEGDNNRFPSDHPLLTAVMSKAQEQHQKIKPHLEQRISFLLDELEYGPVKKGIILDNNFNCMSFATLDYFDNHDAAEIYVIYQAGIVRSGRAEGGHFLPLMDRNELENIQVKNGDIALIVKDEAGHEAPMHVGRVVENPRDGSLWIADKAGSGGLYLSTIESWLFNNPIYSPDTDSAYIVHPPKSIQDPESQPLQRYLISIAEQLTSSDMRCRQA